jgi:3-isopropylmalate/(R)-2-methylmalate dehydratase small subunit
MLAIKQIKGLAIPMNMTDIDTDIIIPAQYLTSTSQTGYGKYAFARLKSDADFVLNQKKYKTAPILITGANFGCGSSREHAIWAIKELGIQAIIAESFADIFTNNATKNGLLLIKQDKETVAKLMQQAQSDELTIKIDVENQTLKTQDIDSSFQMDAFFKHCLINGLDELDYLMSNIENIKEFKNKQVNTTLFIHNY